MLSYVLAFQLLRTTLNYTQTKGPSCLIVTLYIEDEKEIGEYSQVEESSSDTRRESLEPLLSAWSRLERFSVTFEEFVYYSDGIAIAGTFSDEEILQFSTETIQHDFDHKYEEEKVPLVSSNEAKSDLTCCTVSSSIEK